MELHYKLQSCKYCDSEGIQNSNNRHLITKKYGIHGYKRHLRVETCGLQTKIDGLQLQKIRKSQNKHNLSISDQIKTDGRGEDMEAGNAFCNTFASLCIKNATRPLEVLRSNP
jgi:hypothetical protein